MPAKGAECQAPSASDAASPAGERAQDDAIVLRDVAHTFTDRRGAPVRALAGVSLLAARGELLALVGPSGCGKTTLLELICSLQAPTAELSKASPAALMPQRDLLLPWLSAVDNAALALRIAGTCRARVARSRAAELFAQLGLDGFERAHPSELSGGMRQRVAFARTLLSGKPVLCLDEPFGALDALTRAEMQEWLAAALAREPRTTVLVTHDVEEAIVLADRVLVLSPRPGRVIGELAVAVPRPRSRTDGAVLALREQALALLARAPGAPVTARDAGEIARSAALAERRARARRLAARLAAAAGPAGAAARRLGDLCGLGRRPAPSCCPPPTKSPRRCGTTPDSSPATSCRRPRRSCSASRWRSCSASRWPCCSTSPARCAARCIRLRSAHRPCRSR